MGNTHPGCPNSVVKSKFKRRPEPPATPKDRPGLVHPGSPLQCSVTGNSHSGFGKGDGFSELTEPDKVLVVLSWKGEGKTVDLKGSFDNWELSYPMEKTALGFTLVKFLSPGVYQYKFIVDGEWRHAADQPAIHDELGNINNVLEVHQFEPDVSGTREDFDPPPSPPESYDCPPLGSDDFHKGPPTEPPHLASTLLNIPSAQTWPSCLPRPSHVVLNHVYSERSASCTEAMVLGTTTRYKAKYITTVMYRPVRPPESSQAL
uniref:5'-AMP-activated protein kinase, regulatory beta subunit n=1 Tax=Tetraselmis sp. GSL018 TaxID=582737 RepID=A0A061SAM4_9CHLO|eukprot:CAMPEP_0177588556 /NCGR_PEP_ID=MMETSP0419_2-20121207/6290_1 /TAXON_ID=582737 /ORGANISM="Tetraselmis sp., Strain GSL018" /LENGTH=260 /DNA_ID=CAMNT_0019078765 /DNA_START=487 /DNA_END=1269 /DNA_ORIENTATION=-